MQKRNQKKSTNLKENSWLEFFLVLDLLTQWKAKHTMHCIWNITQHNCWLTFELIWQKPTTCCKTNDDKNILPYKAIDFEQNFHWHIQEKDPNRNGKFPTFAMKPPALWIEASEQADTVISRINPWQELTSCVLLIIFHP